MAAAPEQPPYRPPSEAASVLVRVTRGCPWNRCSFCGMYKRVAFELRQVDEIERDIAALGGLHPRAASVFLADSDSLVHPELPRIVAAVRRGFPEASRITSYARLTTLRKLPGEALRRLRAEGLTRIHAGLESGSKRVLKKVRKGVHPTQAIEAGRRAMEAGFELSLYVLSGLGGRELWQEHAAESARVIRAIWPHFVRLRSLVILPGTPLGAAREAGTFLPVSPLERLRETRLLTRELLPETAMPPHELELASDHFTNMVWADGRLVYGGANGYLPGDRDLLLESLDEAIITVEEARRATDPSDLALGGHSFRL